MKALTIALLMWISSHTPMTYDGSHFPNVVTVPHERLVHILYEGDLPQGLDSETVSVAETNLSTNVSSCSNVMSSGIVTSNNFKISGISLASFLLVSSSLNKLGT